MMDSSFGSIGEFFIDNRERYPTQPGIGERVGDSYCFWTWAEITNKIFSFSEALSREGLRRGDRVAFIAGNSYSRFIAEMAVISSGFVSVPLFAGYPSETLQQLIEFSEVEMLIVDQKSRLDTFSARSIPMRTISLDSFSFPSEMESSATIKERFQSVPPDTTAFIMYTSGTSQFPKGVQLCHRHILSQQQALSLVWNPRPGLKTLSYLPWHHSFGGLFERFFVVASAGCLGLDDSAGKNIDRMLENFDLIKPNCFFSVPKVYQEIVARVLTSPKIEESFFHRDLEFVFTAAAPLPLSVSDVFKEKGVPVVEGWGLTETSPCCTLTPKTVDRIQGVVGFAIPGVEIRLDEENEILVRGPNVMTGYWRQEEATREVLSEDGWFKTGDLGEMTPAGLKILSRKDRMFKLDNGEKIFPPVLEEQVKTHCKFVKHAYVFGAGQRNPLLIVFPSNELLASTSRSLLDRSNCLYPKDPSSFSNCLGRCLIEINSALSKIERIDRALVINRELSLDRGELTPSFKVVPRRVSENYHEYIRAVEDGRFEDLPEDAYVVRIRKEECCHGSR